MVNETKREEEGEKKKKANKYIIEPVGSVRANFPAAKWDRMTSFLAAGGFISACSRDKEFV